MSGWMWHAEHENFWRRNMKWSRFVFRMKTGAIRVLQGAREKDEAMLRNQAVGTEGLGGCQARC